MEKKTNRWIDEAYEVNQGKYKKCEVKRGGCWSERMAEYVGKVKGKEAIIKEREKTGIEKGENNDDIDLK